MVAALDPGTIVDRFRVEAMIGVGSMGDVVRGIDVELKRPVAIKILSDKHRENKELRARFVREARAVAAISHPNVVQVFTTGTFDDRPYIAMELLKGVDLGTVVAERGVMSSLQAARAALDAARGLEAAAKAGLIHRDVKPSNLVLQEDGVVKVTDFGLAKPLNPSDEPALTALGVVVGTPDYIAPEQARGDAIDERVDIYALGGTLFFLLAGRPPFRTGNASEDKYLKVVARHLKDPAPDPRDVSPGVDAELARLCLAMMSKRRNDRPRYPELIEMLGALVDRFQHAGMDPGAPPVAIARESSAPSSPTPFLGGNHRLDTSGGSGLPEGSGDPAFVRGGPREPHDESAETTVRGETAPGTGSELSASVQVPAVASRWLLWATVLSALVFVVGLGLFLFGPMPKGQKVAAAPADAAVPIVDAAVQPPPIPEPPAGMIVVLKADGSPWLFVHKRPVSHGEYASLFPNKKKKHSRKSKNLEPVVGVSYPFAESYAKATSMRLLTPEEWRAAAATEGFETEEKLWEWVDDGTVGSQAKRAVIAAPDKLEKRRPSGGSEITFRLGREP